MGDVAALTWPLTRPGGLLPLPSNRVRRCLFGAVDHEKTKAHLKQEMDKMMAADSAKWNFDFSMGRPLPGGRYLWEPVSNPKDADSNGGSQPAEEEEKSPKRRQTQITDFMRKRKSSNEKELVTLPPKTRRRSST